MPEGIEIEPINYEIKEKRNSQENNNINNGLKQSFLNRSDTINSKTNSITSKLKNNNKKDKTDEVNIKLAEMGYKPELERSFSAWSLLAIGFGLTNSWFGISASLVTGISSGGPVCIVYGIIIVAVISSCIGATLSELVSAYPNAGGQYYWTSVLSNKKYSAFLSYLCGAFAWAGSVFTTISVTMSIANGLVGMYILNQGGNDFVTHKWMVFVAYQLVNIVSFFFNCYAPLLPALGNASLYVSLFSFVVILITVLACASPNYQDAKFVFANFVNATGWKNNGIAFIVGLVNPNWSFSCLDSATHLAEETARPERDIPIAIMGTVAIGFVTAFTYSIAMFFSMKDLDELQASITGFPIMDIFYQAIENKGAALFLASLIIITAFGCQFACQTWQARLCWSFARDRGILGSHWWAQVHPKLGVPLNAHILNSVWVAILGCLYLGSSAAFYAMVTACIIMLYWSYAVPVLCLLIKGRNNITHGPFWLGKLGLVCNYVALLWTVFTTVFFTFPSVMPATAGNMNYVCVVIGIWAIYCIIYWFVRGRKVFLTADVRMNDAARRVQEIIDTPQYSSEDDSVKNNENTSKEDDFSRSSETPSISHSQEP